MRNKIIIVIIRRNTKRKEESLIGKVKTQMLKI